MSLNPLVSPLYISDRQVESMPRLIGPVTPPDAQLRVQPIFQPVTTDLPVIETTGTDLLILPNATDLDIYTMLAEYGYPTQALIFEIPPDVSRPQRYHILASQDVPDAIELIPLTS